MEEANPAQRDRMKVDPIGDQLRHGRPFAGARARPPPADRRRVLSALRERAPEILARAAGTLCDAALNARRIESSYGWPLRISHSPNQRSLLNFPMQSDGAEMLREATVRLCDAGIVPIMLVHDGILFEEDGPAQDRGGQGDHARRRPRDLRRHRRRRRPRLVDVRPALAIATSARWRRRCGRTSSTSCNQSGWT